MISQFNSSRIMELFQLYSVLNVKGLAVCLHVMKFIVSTKQNISYSYSYFDKGCQKKAKLRKVSWVVSSSSPQHFRKI